MAGGGNEIGRGAAVGGMRINGPTAAQAALTLGSIASNSYSAAEVTNWWSCEVADEWAGEGVRPAAAMGENQHRGDRHGVRQRRQ